MRRNTIRQRGGRTGICGLVAIPCMPSRSLLLHTSAAHGVSLGPEQSPVGLRSGIGCPCMDDARLGRPRNRAFSRSSWPCGTPTRGETSDPSKVRGGRTSQLPDPSPPGTLWGSSTILFLPLDEPNLLFLALVISGMCAGAATVHAAHFPSVVAFIFPAILPLAVDFFVQGSRLQIVSGIMACVFAISLCLASLKFRAWFRETTSARLNLVLRTSEAADANARLRAENAQRRSTEAKLQQAQKMEAIGLLTAEVAHDFNNLLLAIGGSTELVVRRHGSTRLRQSTSKPSCTP